MAKEPTRVDVACAVGLVLAATDALGRVLERGKVE